MNIKQTKVAKYAAVIALALTANLAMAATTGQEFKGLADMVSGWSEGYLGMALGLTAFFDRFGRRSDETNHHAMYRRLGCWPGCNIGPGYH